MTEIDMYDRVLLQEVCNIKGEIRHAATISIRLLIDGYETILEHFNSRLKDYKLDHIISIDYHVENNSELIVLIYDNKYRYNKKSPADIFHNRWTGKLSEILVYKYYRMFGCSTSKAKEYAKKIMSRESSN